MKTSPASVVSFSRDTSIAKSPSCGSRIYHSMVLGSDVTFIPLGPLLPFWKICASVTDSGDGVCIKIEACFSDSIQYCRPFGSICISGPKDLVPGIRKVAS